MTTAMMPNQRARLVSERFNAEFPIGARVLVRLGADEVPGVILEPATTCSHCPSIRVRLANGLKTTQPIACLSRDPKP